MSRIKEQLTLTYQHLVEHGFKEAYNYAYFRYLFSVHSTFVSRLINYWAPYPPYIEIETTTKCNLKCLMCEHTYWNEPNRDMSYDQFLHIMDQFPRLKWIGLTGIGESFLNKEFIKMVRYVKERNIILELFDTFYYWDKDISFELLKLGLNRVLPSFDAATATTYENIRANSDFHRVVKNLRDMFAMKRYLRKQLPDVCFHFIVSKSNIDEMLPYLDLIKDISEGQSVAVQFTEVLYGFPEISNEVVPIPESLVSDVSKKAASLKIRLIWNRNVHKQKPQINRCTLWTMPFIFVTGDVIPCCGGNEANRRDFQRKTSLGNIFKDDFRTIWNNANYRKLRELIRQNKTPVQCVNCPAFECEEKR